MTGEIDADPYAVLGVLLEGAVQVIAQRIPAEQQGETAATLAQLLEERLKARGARPRSVARQVRRGGPFRAAYTRD
jgi:hypothetical protein